MRRPIEDLASFGPVNDQTAVLQAGDVLGHVALRATDAFHQILHPQLTVHQRQQNRQPRGIGEPTEQLGRRHHFTPR